MRSPVFQHILILFLCSALSTSLSHAQKATFKYFTLVDGLAGNDISQPAQDIQGTIWVVCDGKLQKFDGERFVTHPGRPDGLAGVDERLLSVTSFQDSLLLMASAHHLYLFNPHLGQWQAFGFDKEHLFSEFNYIGTDLACFSTYKGQAIKDHSVWMFDNYKVKPFPALVGKNSEMGQDFRFSFGQFIIDADSTVYNIQDGVVRKISYDGTVLVEESQLSLHPRISRIAKLDTNHLLVLHPKRFYILDLDLNQIDLHPASRFLEGIYFKEGFQDILIEKDGSFWTCTSVELMYYDSQRDTLYTFGQSLTSVGLMQRMLLDDTGILWVQTDRGLLKVSFRKFPFSTFFGTGSPGEDGNQFRYSFRGITEDRQGVIYAAYYTGFAFIDKQDRHGIIGELNKRWGWVPFDIHFGDENIYTNYGQMLDLAREELIDVPGITKWRDPYLGVFARDDKGQLFRIGLDTLFVLDESVFPGKWDYVTSFNIPNPFENSAEVMYFSKAGRELLIGCRKTLYSYDPMLDRVRSFSGDDWGIPIQRLMAIEEDSAGVYWLGTDIGLIRFNTHTNAVEQYTTRDGLCNDFVCSMLSEGDSALWLGTNVGLSRFDIPSGQFVNFYVDDGLTTNEFNRISYHKATDGRMFFGGMYGMNAFYPDEIMKNYRRQNERAKLILVGFEKVDEKRGENVREIAFNDHPELHLYHWDRSFEFQYLLTDYTKPEEVRYSYKMEGYEDRWSEYSGDNFIRYSSLPPGRYTLQVKARDHHGQEHPNQMSVALIVHPPWWKTSWAYVLYVLIVVGIGYTIFRFYMRRWTLQHELQIEQDEAMRLKELDTFKSRLYTNLTHEFRTPLTVILGMTDQMEENPKRGFREGLELIRKNGTQLLNLINQLLDLSKLENNAFQLQLVQGNIIPFLRYVCSSFESFAQKHQISLSMYVETERVVMDFDPEQIKQVMNNLISNAVKFTPSGGTIDIRVMQEDQELILEVQDSGAGISAADIDHIFDRFYQADTSESRKWEGSGIGLAHTRELVGLMDGKIEVESNADTTIGPTGTCFRLHLPVRTAEDTPAAALIDVPEVIADSGEMEEMLHSYPGNGNQSLPQLLIIEDNPDVVAYLVSCLRSDYQIDVAINGKEGLGKAVEGIPDLIISDVMMPEMDGFEMCAILKKDERTSHIPVIMLTAKADTSSKIEGLEHGADAYLYKPFNKKELLVRIEMMLRKKQQLADYYMRMFRGGLDVDKVPEAAGSLPIENSFILKVRHIIEENFTNENFALPDLAKAIGMSRSQLYRKMKALVDTSPSDFIRNYRLGKARKLLREHNLNVSEVAWKVGYKDIAHFSRSYQSAFGENPSEVLKK